MTAKKKEKKPTLEEYLADGKIKQNLYDTIQKIPSEDKQARVLETLHRRIDKRGSLPAQ